MKINTHIRFILAGIASTFSFVDAQDCGDAQEWENTMNSQPGYAQTAVIKGGIVLKGDEQMGDEGDIFAAFDESCNVRGIATVQIPTSGQYVGTTVYEMTMGSNTVGDILHFKFYDESIDVIYDIVETYEFVINDQIGNLIDPVFYNIVLPVLPFVTLSFSHVTSSSINIEYESNAAIAGFQFLVTGVNMITVVSDLGDVSVENGMVLVFSFTGAALPAGSGILVSLDEFEEIINEEATLVVSDIVISDINGNAISHSGPGSKTIYPPPISFIYASSQQLGYYYFKSVTINDALVDAQDWVGTYNGETCVGARQWDTSICGGGECDVPVLGYDGSELTEGYMLPGDVPTFKIYDASENAYYDAEPYDNDGIVDDVPWYNFGMPVIYELSAGDEVTIAGCMDGGITEYAYDPDLSNWGFGTEGEGVEACNYDNMATEEDGSCLYGCIGCMDEEACNYESDNTVDCGDCCDYPDEYFDCNDNYCQGDGEELDCSGECNGSAVYDLCLSASNPNGICGGDNSSCADCAGTPNGSAVEDMCGTCDADSSNNCVQDCNGIWGGTTVYDLCVSADNPNGICGGDNSTCTDCNGDLYGTAFLDFSGFFIDDCGDGALGEASCVGGNTGELPCTQDCEGNWGGSAVEDNCGHCHPGNEVQENGMHADCLNDCTGTPGGLTVYDLCVSINNPNGICGGDNSTCADCAGTAYGNATADNCSTCDSDASNDCTQDCAGNWGGSAVVDDCGTCCGGTTDIDCIENEDECACPEEGEERDCTGECGGTAEDDQCGVCGGDNSSCVDCAGTPYGNATKDNCGTCDDDSSNDCVADCAGNWGGSAIEDNCGHCHPGNEVQENGTHADCLKDCSGITENIYEYDECGICRDPECAGGALPEDWNYNPCPEGEYPENLVWNWGCFDCNNEFNGSAYIDPNCGDGALCVEGNTGLTTCTQDCVGIWGGAAVYDLCVSASNPNGICGGDNSTCTDCSGVPNGDAKYDICGTLCIINNPSADCSAYCDSDSSNDCVQDCTGQWGGLDNQANTGDELVNDECNICGGDCYGEEGAECGNYDCDGNCIAELDCEYTCGGPVVPTVECPGDTIVCFLSECDLAIQPHLLPDNFGINKIFPNPFNPVTQVQYDISAYAFVKVRIFDIRGREVAQLMNQYQNPGQYHLTWDAGNHASGMYIVEMVIRSRDDAAIFRDIRKILYLK